MTRTTPWIFFHAPWTERARSGMVVLERVQRFLAAVAVDPTPDSAELNVYGEESLAAEVAQAMGSAGKYEQWSSGSMGSLFRTTWRFERPFDETPIVAVYRSREADPPVDYAPSRRGVGLTLYHSFEVKRPGAVEPLFPGAELRSSVMIHIAARGANLALRYDSPEMTPALREAHAEIVAALGSKTPRHALVRVIPATRPNGREKRQPIS